MLQSSIYRCERPAQNCIRYEVGNICFPNHGIWIDKQDKVYVVDRDNNRVQIFNSDGDYITEWRDFFHPMDIFQDRNDVFYVTDQTPRISVLNNAGKILARGFAPDAGHGIWGDSVGNIYLAGHNRGVVKLLKI